MTAMTSSEQQEALRTVAPASEGEIPTSITQKDEPIMSHPLSAVTDWKSDLIASTPGLLDPADARSLIEQIDNREEAEQIVRECVPTFPTPTLPAPEWVDEVGQWEWLGTVDRQWARRTSKEIEVPNSDGGTSSVSLSCWQYGDEDGSHTDPPSLEVDIESEDVTTIRGLAAWFTKVADIIEGGAA